MRITEVKLTKKQRVELEYIEHFDSRPFMQKRSRIILDKADGMPLKEDSGKAVVLGTQGQPLGQTVSRQDVAKPTRQYKARLMYNNCTVLDGAANITQITNHSVKLQLLGQLAMHNSNDKENRVYIDELDLGNFAMDLAPEVYGKTATGWNWFAYGRTDGRNTLGADSWANDPNKPIQFYPAATQVLMRWLTTGRQRSMRPEPTL